MVKVEIYFDMDGTIVDFYNYPNWLEYLNNEQTKPYRNALPLVDLEEANNIMNLLKQHGYIFTAVTWLSKNSSTDFERRTKQAKRYWLNKHFPSIFQNNKMVSYGVPKHEVVDPTNKILFDDNEEVGTSWQNAGGVWINPQKVDIVSFLKTLAVF